MVHILIDGGSSNSSPAALYFKETQVVKVPAGTGVHTISFVLDPSALILVSSSTRALKIAFLAIVLISGLAVLVWYLKRNSKKIVSPHK